MTVEELPFACGGPTLTGRIRVLPEDFHVEEIPGFEPSGEGEHHWLWVEKRLANTEWVARQLAAHAGALPMDVGFAGRKDRHAVTRQAFTVRVPGKREVDWQAFEAEGVRVLSSTRHSRKLPRGALAGNRFALRFRNVDGNLESAMQQLGRMFAAGMPNYFGEQRFGREGGNIAAAEAMFAGKRVRRDERNLLLSAARSSIFNAVLAARVTDGSWNLGGDGDVWQLDGSGSIFGPEPMTLELAERQSAGAIHPTGALWGRGMLRSAGSVAELERECAAAQAGLANGLESAGVDMQRRALRVRVSDASAKVERDEMLVGFVLPAGSYATCLIREVLRVQDDASTGTSGTGLAYAEE